MEVSWEDVERLFDAVPPARPAHCISAGAGENRKQVKRNHAATPEIKRQFAGPLSFPRAQIPVRLPEQIKLPRARVRAGDNSFFPARRSNTDSAASRTPSSTIALTIRLKRVQKGRRPDK
jgi:hypothetical protein